MITCTNCTYRTEHLGEKFRFRFRHYHHVLEPKDYTTNKSGFCQLGYTQNPAGKAAVENALANKAEVCEKLQ